MENQQPGGPGDHWVETRLLGGRARVLQPRSGYRAGLDAALLGASVGAQGRERVLEAGAGAGAALIQAALRAPEAAFVGVERDGAALELFCRNLGLNALQDRAAGRQGDVQDGFAALEEAPFDVAFANPPFFDDPASLRGPHPSRRGAWLADGGLQAWTEFLLKAVKPKGRILMIHRADRLGDILSLLGRAAGSFQILPVHPFADAPAKRVLVRAIHSGKAPLVIRPPLVLHERRPDAPGGVRSTERAQAVLRGEADLAAF